MKTYKNIIIKTNKNLGLLTLDRQEENNSLNIETSKEIYEGLRELEMNSSIRVILVQGNQKFFGTCHRSQGARFTGARAIGCIGAWGVGVERDPGSLL